MDALLEGLNEAQRSAVTSPGDVLQILAPPGSGKTKTLTTRVAYLIAHHGYNPRNMIVCTFTVKAAKEMKERIQNFLGEDLAGRLILGTFHSIARRYLAKFGHYIGIDSKFGISDSSDTLSTITRIIKRLKFNIQPGLARSRISRFKSKCIGPEEAATTKQVEQQEFAQVYAEYEEALKLANLLDYDDLLLRCADLLRARPECVSNIEALLIDEFQDTNNVQFDLMTGFAWATKRITIVGDPDQSIYGFRSAEIKNLTRMREQYPDTVVINLEENYRSAGAILLAASEVIEQDLSRPQKKLKPTHSLGLQPVLRKLPSASAEANWIVTELKRSVALTGELFKWSDFAVLLRSASLSRLIESALGKAGIPYRMVGGHRFFDRMEVKLVLDYLRVINHPDHNDALVRIVNIPSRRVGDVTIQNLLQEADQKKITLWTLVLSICRGRRKTSFNISSQAQQGLDMFTNLILTSQKKLGEAVSSNETLADFIKFVVKKIGVEEHLKRTKQEDWEARWANVEELFALASDPVMEAAMDEESLWDPFEEADKEAGIPEPQQPLDFSDVHQATKAEPLETVQQKLTKFLANVALSTEVQREEDNCSERVEQVTLSTIHAAKGLEWPVVFVPAMYDGSIPHSRAEDNDEERRLLYVAMTRAQSILYLSCPKRDSRYTETVLSHFVSENPMPLYFAETGPDITFDDVRELAVILRRDCPSTCQIETSRSELEHAKDDLWPVHGEENEESLKRWEFEHAEQSLDQLPAFKRRRLDGDANHNKRWGNEAAGSVSTLGRPTTVQQANTYSIATTTTHKAVFMTAAAAMVSITQEETARKETNKANELVAVQKTKTAKLQSGQSNLTAFFVKSSSSSSTNKPGNKDSDDQMHLRRSPMEDITNVDTGPKCQDQSAPRTKLVLTDDHLHAAATMHPGLAAESGRRALQVTRKTLGMRRSLQGWESRKHQ